MQTSGFLIVDKPLRLTSREAVDRAARWFPRGTRLGHTGTLDPLASGVLVVAVGAATRLTEYVQRMPKTYRAVFALGARSDTADGEGTIAPTPGASPPPLATVEEAIQAFIGDIDQVPPIFSAAKVGGRRAYVLARRGRDVELEPRRVRIDAIAIRRYDYPVLDVEIRCGKGTYIRSLARDLGERLGCGGYVQELRRTCIGPFDVHNAVPLDADEEAARRALLDLAWAAHGLRRVELSNSEAERFAQGQALPRNEFPGEVAVMAEGERFVGIGRIGDDHMLWPAKVFWTSASGEA
jgi:tRNA pseudouridine55 synthase